MKNTDTVTLTLKYERETEKAWGVRLDEDSQLVWLPKSQCEVGEGKDDGVIELTMPEWLAIEKELI